ncbi:unnamed protein product [Brassica oleracea]
MALKRASFTSSLFIVSSFQLHIYHPPPFSVHLKGQFPLPLSLFVPFNCVPVIEEIFAVCFSGRKRS